MCYYPHGAGWETQAKILAKVCQLGSGGGHLEGWDRDGGREMQEGRDMGIYVYV